MPEVFTLCYDFLKGDLDSCYQDSDLPQITLDIDFSLIYIDEQ